MSSTHLETVISSLIGRLRLEGDAYILPEGRLSAVEVEALRVLASGGSTESSNLEGYSSDPHKPIASPQNERTTNDTKEGNKTAPSAEVNLDMTAVEVSGPQETDMRLCIDFGTAMSKAWAAGRDIELSLPLNLGETAGEADSFVLPSTVFVARSGKIFFGQAAERQLRQELEFGRQAFDNIKRVLSEAEVGQDLNEVPVDETIDPTCSGITKGDLLLLYLGWLTDHSLKALHSEITTEEGEIPREEATRLRSVRRRFAIPCFESAIDEGSQGAARSEWASAVLSDVMLKAQIVADTLGAKWEELCVSDTLPILRTAHRIKANRLSHLLAERPTIREPIAAGASRFSDEVSDYNQKFRRMLLVIDAGAGTTDFAVFQTFIDPERKDQQVRYALIRQTVKMSRIAGNEIDAVLRPHFLQAAGINPENGAPRSENDFYLIKNDLNSQIRELKQILFADGEVEYNLRPGIRGKLEIGAVLADPAYKKCGAELLQIRRSIICALFDEEQIREIAQTNIRFGKAMPISVLLTGGSSTIPILEEMSRGTLEKDGASFEFGRVRNLPDWIENVERGLMDRIGAHYPQCAVAIGGTAPVLPDEVDDFSQAITAGPRHEWEAQRFQTQGL